MILIEGLDQYLRRDPTITSIVGSRVYQGVIAPSVGLPAVVISEIVRLHQSSFSGLVGKVYARVQIDCWTEGDVDSHYLAQAVIDLLCPVQDVVVQTNYGDLELDGCILITDQSKLMKPGHVNGPAQRRRMLEFRVCYTEGMPQ